MSASGLSSPMVCPAGDATYTPALLILPFPNSLTTDSIQPDPTTQQLPQSAVQSFVNSLTASGAIPTTPVNPGTGLPDTSAMATQDSSLQSKIGDRVGDHKQGIRGNPKRPVYQVFKHRRG